MSADLLDRASTLARACDALTSDDMQRARAILQTEYPFTPSTHAGRRYTEAQALRIFLRDGFVDRYSGRRLVFPGTLRLLSRLLPDDFPAHLNWKMANCHIAFWELFPTLDHVVPVARGGANDDTNWVTTSMVRNSAKSNWLLEELRSTLRCSDPESGWELLAGFFRRERGRRTQPRFSPLLEAKS